MHPAPSVEKPAAHVSMPTRPQFPSAKATVSHAGRPGSALGGASAGVQLQVIRNTRAQGRPGSSVCRAPHREDDIASPAATAFFRAGGDGAWRRGRARRTTRPLRSMHATTRRRSRRSRRFPNRPQARAPSARTPSCRSRRAIVAGGAESCRRRDRAGRLAGDGDADARAARSALAAAGLARLALRGSGLPSTHGPRPPAANARSEQVLQRVDARVEVVRPVLRPCRRTGRVLRIGLGL